MSARHLVLEGASDAGSVAVVSSEGVVASIDFGSRDPVTGARTEMLGRAVQDALSHAGMRARDLAGVICDAGPGSFTSLRCAAAIAKGMCAALELPLYAVSSLDLLVHSVDQLDDGAYIAALDAGRGEWFAADAEVTGREITLSATRLVSDPALRAHAAGLDARIIGRGEAVDAVPRAAAVARILERVVAAGELSLDSWEPEYGRLAEAQVRWEAQHGRPLVG